MPHYTEAGWYCEANVVALSDGKRKAIFVPVQPVEGAMPVSANGYIRTPEGVIVRVTGRSPELFPGIHHPERSRVKWPVHAGTFGYDVAKEIAGLASEGEPVSLSDGRKRKSAFPGYGHSGASRAFASARISASIAAHSNR